MTMIVKIVALFQWPAVERPRVCRVSVPSLLCPCAHDGTDMAHLTRRVGASYSKNLLLGRRAAFTTVLLHEGGKKKKDLLQEEKNNF